MNDDSENFINAYDIFSDHYLRQNINAVQFKEKKYIYANIHQNLAFQYSKFLK